MKYRLIIYILPIILLVSCKPSNKILILYNSGNALPKQMLDTVNKYSVNLYSNSKIIIPKSKNIAKYLLPNDLIIKSKPSAMILQSHDSKKGKKNIYTFYNYRILIDFLNKEDSIIVSAYYLNKKKVLIDSTYFYQYRISDKKLGDFKILDFIQTDSLNNYIRLLYITTTDWNENDNYPYMQLVAPTISKTLILNPLIYEQNKLQKSKVVSYMFEKYRKNGNYILARYFLNYAKNNIKDDNIEYYNTIYNTFVGDYNYLQNNLSGTTKVFNNTNINFISAGEYIDSIAKNYDIILFNEDHRYPYCRYFVRKRLHSLKKQGYSALGIETLNYLKQDSIRPIHGLGFFTDEPQMSNLVREAVRLGFKVFPYEAYSSQCATCKSQRERLQYRETQQAKNILAEIEKNNNSKCIILSGHAHIYKSNVDSTFYYMAQELKRNSKMKILTINQTFQNEYAIPAKLKKDDYIPFVENKPFLGHFANSEFDIQVIHNGKYHYNKNFNFNQDIGSDVSVKLNFPKVKEGFFLIYDLNEYNCFKNRAIPVSGIKIKNKKHIKLNLNKGDYIYQLYDCYANPLYYEKIIVK